jgi:hypothetical protein
VSGGADAFLATGFFWADGRAGATARVRIGAGALRIGCSRGSAAGVIAGAAVVDAVVVDSIADAAVDSVDAGASARRAGATAATVVVRAPPREATTTAETPETRMIVATATVIVRRSSQALRASAASRAIRGRLSRMTASENERSALRVVDADVPSARRVTDVARASARCARAVVCDAVRASPARAGAVAVQARPVRTRHAGRAGGSDAIGSRSSNRIGSGGGTGTSGGAAAKKPCSSSLHGPSFDGASVATSMSEA